MIILQRHGLLLRVHGAVWMYIRRFDVATRFHLPQKTRSQLHSDLLFLMRYPVLLLSFTIVALNQLFWYQVPWHQYNTYCILFEQGLSNMAQSYWITFDLLQYFETLKHNTSALELFYSASFIAILPISAPRQWISCWRNALWASCTTLCAWYYNYMAASSQTLRAWKVNLDIGAPHYLHIIHILRAWHPWIHPFYYQGSPLRLLTHLIHQPQLHYLSTHHLYTGNTNTPQSALSVHSHTHLQQNTTASTPEQTLHAAPPATPKTAGPTPAARRSKAPRARSHSPNSDDSTSHHSATAAPSRPSPHFSDPRAISNPATEPTSIPAAEPSPPESPIGTIPAPWSSQEDETLISLKSDSKARPSWASVGARMRRTPSECKARWQLLRSQQTAPSETTPPPPPTSTNPGPPRPPTPHS